MPENSKLSADELLRLFLDSPHGTDYAQFLDLLIENFALPVIKKSLNRKIKRAKNNGFYVAEQDFEDLCHESSLKVIEKITVLRKSKEKKPIRDFENYVAVITFNCWNEFWGKLKPNRQSLKNKIRYLFSKSKDFEMWLEGDKKFCGLIKINRQFRQISAEDLVIWIEDEFENFRNVPLNDLLFGILKRADSKIGLNELVSIVAQLWAIEDLRDDSFDEFSKNGFSSEKNQENDFEMRFKLKQIWQEICDLPVNQRIALLYNLRDEAGREMLFMFFNAKIARLSEIADSMNLSLEKCARTLPRLPLEDHKIAQIMNLTAKQVGNLRKVARDNLRRRLIGKPKRKKRAEASKKADEEKNNENNFDPAFGES